jgi:uncharacterized membrane protein YhhN
MPPSPRSPLAAADSLGLGAYAVLSLVSVSLIPLGVFSGLALIRMAPTVLLAFLALRSTRQTFGTTIAWGLLLGAAGDYFLNTFDPDQAPFGVLAFFAGHIAYIAGMRRAGWQPSKARWRGVAALVAFGLVYGGVILWFNPTQPLRRIAWLTLDPSPQMLPVAPALLAYMPLLIGMASVALLRRGSRMVTAGALVFVASDALIPLNQFLLPKAHPGDPWASTALLYPGFITYYLAQYLIARGAMTEELPPPSASIET